MDPINPLSGSLLTPLRTAAAGQGSAASALRAAGAAGDGGGFGAALARAIEQVDVTQQEAGTRARSFQMGDPSASLEETMISMQKANISFQALVQVRNRVVSAYHDIMNMPV